MNVTGALLSVLMDDIKKIEDLLRYSADARDDGKAVEMEWFNRHIFALYDTVTDDYAWIKRNTCLQEKLDDGDPISASLDSFICDKLHEISRRIDDL